MFHGLWDLFLFKIYDIPEKCWQGKKMIAGQLQRFMLDMQTQKNWIVLAVWCYLKYFFVQTPWYYGKCLGREKKKD